jgi:hypothetical protein
MTFFTGAAPSALALTGLNLAFEIAVINAFLP